jgi:hypothetical protein
MTPQTGADVDFGNQPNVLLDTSAVIDFEGLDGRAVAAQVTCDYAALAPGIRAITLAELAAGPHATADPRALSSGPRT